tara:strand:- start:521 stop:778 length:258 start_codon:yes stop_codon:yes gene_type:complete
MSKNKQLIMITAPFGCGFCKRAQAELPELCESKGWELIEIENERGKEQFPVESYPTFMVRINDKMVDTLKGYGGKDKMEDKLKKY